LAAVEIIVLAAQVGANWWRLGGKRAFDVVVSLLGLLLLAPVLVVTAVIVQMSLGSPILFRQSRPGRWSRIFTMYKFRTMRDVPGPDGQPLPDADRLTGVGRLMRKWSLDELPELYNVLKGDMSLVGPRPLLEEYLTLYNARQARRHEVRPGITGWAQINGRNRIGWDHQLELDVWYVEHVSPGLDLAILLRTVGRVFSSRDVNQQGHATRSKFRGHGS
jgi:sugar transferase EpsL